MNEKELRNCREVKVPMNRRVHQMMRMVAEDLNVFWPSFVNAAIDYCTREVAEGRMRPETIGNELRLTTKGDAHEG
jgi:hypothetical protein